MARIHSTQQEIDLIITHCLKHKDVMLESNASRSVSACSERNTVWTEILNRLNNSRKTSKRSLANLDQVKNIFGAKKKRISEKLREHIVQEKSYRSTTGGGVDEDMEERFMEEPDSIPKFASDAENKLAEFLLKSPAVTGIGNSGTSLETVPKSLKRNYQSVKIEFDDVGADWKNDSDINYNDEDDDLHLREDSRSRSSSIEFLSTETPRKITKTTINKVLPKEVVPVVIDEEKTEKHAELKEFRKSFAPTRQDCVAMDYESRKELRDMCRAQKEYFEQRTRLDMELLNALRNLLISNPSTTAPTVVDCIETSDAFRGLLGDPNIEESEYGFAK